MFRAYSRRVDRRVFSEINLWLAERGDRTDSKGIKQFTDFARERTPHEYFALTNNTKVEFTRLNGYPFGYNFSFASPLPSGNPKNDTVYGDFFPNYSLDSPSVIILSGWMEGLTDYTRLAHRTGLSGRNFWAIDVPYHGRRTPEGTRSGELAITADLVRTLECVRQAVVDTRTLVAALWALGVRDIALIGFSLGAWIGSLVALAERRITNAVLVTPVVRPDQLFLKSPLFSSLREGVREEDRLHVFDHLKHLFLPAYGKPVIDAHRIHLLGSIDDPLATKEFVKELSLNWGCDACIMPGGHITVYLTTRMWRKLFSLLNVRRQPTNDPGSVR